MPVAMAGLHGPPRRYPLLAPLILLALSFTPLSFCLFSSIGPQQTLKVTRYSVGSYLTRLSSIPTNGSTKGFPGIAAYEDRPAEPSDMALAQGGGYIVQAVNVQIRIFNASTGQPLTPTMPIYKFFNLKPNTTFPGTSIDFISDPRAFYDHLSNRFFVFIWGLSYNNGSFPKDKAFQLIAVSRSSNPLEGFYYYKYNADLADAPDLHPQCPCLPDFNMVGFDQYGVYISDSLFTLSADGSFAGTTFQAVSKQGLIHGSPSPTGIRFDGIPETNGYILQGIYDTMPDDLQAAFTIQPAAIPMNGLPDLSNGGTQFFLSHPYPTEDGLRNGTKLEVWAMTNTSSLNSKTPKLKFTKKSIDVTPHLTMAFLSPAAEQKAGDSPNANKYGYEGFKLSTGDDRMCQVVYSKGTLMGAFTTPYMDSDNVLKTGITYYIISASFSKTTGLIQAKKVYDGFFKIPGSWMFYPAITFNKYRAMVAFGFSGPSYYPSVGAFFIRSSPYRVSNYTAVYYGKAPQDGYTGRPPYGDGITRWGDYSASCVGDKDNFWLSVGTITGGNRTADVNWATYIAKLPAK